MPPDYARWQMAATGLRSCPRGEDSAVIDVPDELPEEEIEAAEASPDAVADHTHDGVTGLDGTLADHLQTMHRLDADPSLSAATQEGLHDRLHGQSKSSDD
jgi:hypothetical protein